MQIIDLLPENAVLAGLKAASRKQALQAVSARAAEISGLDERLVFERLIERERLGSTGVGQGVAIPHARIPGIDGLHAVFLRLDEAVDFEAVDGKPVDLIFMLLSPEQAGADHLKALARISRTLRDQTMCEKLRGSDSAEAIYALLTESFAAAA